MLDQYLVSKERPKSDSGIFKANVISFKSKDLFLKPSYSKSIDNFIYDLYYYAGK